MLSGVTAAVALMALSPEQLIAEGRSAEAKMELEQLLAATPGDVQTLFLIATACVELQDYDCAIHRLREAIAFDPKAPRLRLELARAFYLAKDYDNAAFQFRRALAGELPDPVQANVLRFLADIRKRQRFTYEVSVGIAPDTNINGGSSAREVTLFGLPFELGESARSKSGVGIKVGGSAEYSWPLSETVKLRTGASLRHRNYGDHRFNDTTASAWVGPNWQSDESDKSVAITLLYRRYGGRTYQLGLGARSELTRYLGRRTAMSLGLSGQYLYYPNDRGHDGPVWTASVSATRLVSTSTTIGANLSAIRQSAKVAEFASWTVVPSIGASRDMKGGFTVSTDLSLGWSRYDEADVFFGLRRRDFVTEAVVSLLNRRLAFGRFTPTVGLRQIWQRSSVALYDLHQTRFEFGITRSF